VPVLRRSHEYHRDLQPRFDTSIQTAVANRDQARYVMITFSTSQMQNPDLPCRPAIRNGGARANLPLQRQRCHRSSSFTADSSSCDRPTRAAMSSASTLIGIGCPHALPSCANLHSPALAAPPPTISRGFFPWRLSDAGLGASRTAAIGRHPKPSTIADIHSSTQSESAEATSRGRQPSARVLLSVFAK
jgi:hypothetical protein